MKITKVLIAATMLSTASAASAEQVIVSCNITSSRMNSLQVGTILYSIGDNQWRDWDNEKAAWWGDSCQFFSHVSKNIYCTFTPKQFSIFGSGDGLTVKMTIDRGTGALFASAEGTRADGSRLYNTATGTCVPGTKPAPPKTKF